MSYQHYLLLGIIVGLLFLAACASPVRDIPTDKQCRQDSDCVPSRCCHPDDTVNQDYAPDCKGLLCTQECVPDTLDCEQGEIKCVDGECKAIMNQ